MAIRFGGGEAFDLSVAEGLKQRGHLIHFLVGRPITKKNLISPSERSGIPTTYISSIYLRDAYYRLSTSKSKLARHLAGRLFKLDRHMFEIAVYRHLLSSKPDFDLAHICGLSRLASLLEQRFHRPVFVFWPGKPDKLRAQFIGKYTGNISHGATLQEQIFQSSKIENVPPGVNTKLFYPAPQDEHRNNEDITLLFVGRLVHAKNLSFLLQSFKIVCERKPGVYLLVVGDGPLLPALKMEAKALNVSGNVKFCGFLSGEQLAKVYRNADIFVISSCFESFSLVTLEAMASGLPVVTLPYGYVKNIVLNEKTGFVIESGTMQDYANAILKLSNDLKMRKDFGIEARRIVKKRYIWESSINHIEKIYLRACGKD
jgi:glycosyltransferase involved in cell wall biosynthesis